MAQYPDEFAQIEQKRRKNVQQKMDALVERRKWLNQKVVYELEQLKKYNQNIEEMLLQPYFLKNRHNIAKEEHDERVNDRKSMSENILQMKVPKQTLDDSTIFPSENIPSNTIEDMNDSILNRDLNTSKSHEKSFLDQNSDIERPRENGMVSKDIDPYIAPGSIGSSFTINDTDINLKYHKSETNINISFFFLENYIFTQCYINTEKELSREKTQTTPMEQFKMKMLVNKRIGQITTDTQHLSQIIQICQKNNNLIFTELMIIKMLQQVKIQVTNCFDTYKSYGLLLSELYSTELHSLLLMSLLYNKDTGKNLKSIYSPYFELLRLRSMFQEAYNFFVSILNEPPSFDVFFVIEAYLIILGPTMLHTYTKRFKGVLKLLSTVYIKMGKNEPSTVRIKTMIEQILQWTHL